MTDKVQIIGLMSGTSKDGLDIALVSFDVSTKEYSFDLISYSTVSYPRELLDQLNQIETLSARKIFELDKKIGLFEVSWSTSDFVGGNKTSQQMFVQKSFEFYSENDYIRDYNEFIRLKK